jgi:hypothetical protein
VSIHELFLSKVSKLCGAHLPSVCSFSIVSLHFVLVHEIELHSIPSFMLGVGFSVECLEFSEVLLVAGLRVNLEYGEAEQDEQDEIFCHDFLLRL